MPAAWALRAHPRGLSPPGKGQTGVRPPESDRRDPPHARVAAGSSRSEGSERRDRALAALGDCGSACSARAPSTKVGKQRRGPGTRAASAPKRSDVFPVVLLRAQGRSLRWVAAPSRRVRARLKPVRAARQTWRRREDHQAGSAGRLRGALMRGAALEALRGPRRVGATLAGPGRTAQGARVGETRVGGAPGPKGPTCPVRRRRGRPGRRRGGRPARGTASRRRSPGRSRRRRRSRRGHRRARRRCRS